MHNQNIVDSKVLPPKMIKVTIEEMLRIVKGNSGLKFIQAVIIDDPANVPKIYELKVKNQKAWYYLHILILHSYHYSWPNLIENIFSSTKFTC